MNELTVIVVIIGFGVGFAIAFWVKGKISSQKIKAAEVESERIVQDAKRNAENLSQRG
ncbi:MAG: Rnase Y domain-containing protein [Desulfobacterales bacterium]|nr:Rnase Y domain-containing protein [Desulfobacterales bacterium]